jgi:hypothetical protein
MAIGSKCPPFAAAGESPLIGALPFPTGLPFMARVGPSEPIMFEREIWPKCERAMPSRKKNASLDYKSKS